MTILKLPTFQGYTVDTRLRQFRKIDRKNIRFIDFYSNEGEKLLLKYIESLDPGSDEFKELLKIF